MQYRFIFTMAKESVIFSTLANFYYPHGSRYYLHNVLRHLQLGLLFRLVSLGFKSLSLETIKLNQQSYPGQCEVSPEGFCKLLLLCYSFHIITLDAIETQILLSHLQEFLIKEQYIILFNSFHLAIIQLFKIRI